MPKIKFTYIRPDGDRIHYVNEDDIMVLLSRLPQEKYRRLRAVIFNDQGYNWGRPHMLGYVTAARREIAICALPPRVSLSRYFTHGATSIIRRGEQSPGEYGAVRNRSWPRIAVRRYLIYEVFLHELGHLQEIRPWGKSKRLRFARETKAQEFANYWRWKLWSEGFEHPDLAHHPPQGYKLRCKEKRSRHLII